MVLLTITPAARQAVELYNALESSAAGQLDAEPSLVAPNLGDPVSHLQLVHIARALKKRRGDGGSLQSAGTCRIDLESLLRGANIYSPPPAPKQPPSSQYIALMARLREEEELRAYQRMINPPTPAESYAQRFPNAKAFGAMAAEPAIPEEVDEATYADVNRQMALIINVLVSIIACSVCIWIAARQWTTPQRLGLSMTGSGVVAVAEVAIYMGYIRRIKDAKSEEAQRKEHKEVVDTWVIDGKKDPGLASPSAGAADALRFRKGKHR